MNTSVADISFDDLIAMNSDSKNQIEPLEALIDKTYAISSNFSNLLGAVMIRNYNEIRDFYADFLKLIIDGKDLISSNGFIAFRKKKALEIFDKVEDQFENIGFHYGTQHVYTFVDALEVRGYAFQDMQPIPAIPLDIPLQKILEYLNSVQL